MSIRTTIICFLGFVFGLTAKAQIFPPEFDCIQNDVLFWQAPVNSCGPFVSVDIYSSTSPQGPFVLLASVVDITQLSFADSNPTGEQRYYYLQSNYNCPGEVALSSDTLTTSEIQDSEILAVSVQGSDVLITWVPSSSPQVELYIIYRTTSLGTIPIDTVFGLSTFSYNDIGANPNNNSEEYFVIAQDPCGNSSSFLAPHETIFLTAQGSSCDESIQLSWTPYSAWNNEIDRQEIWVTVGGGQPTLAATLDKDANSYDFTQIQQSGFYCFTVIDIEAGTNATSTSNVFCVNAQFSAPQTDLVLTNLSVRSNDQVELTWYWDLNADLNSYEFFQGTTNSNLGMSFSGLPGFLLNNQVTRIDPTSDASQEQLYFQVNTIDDCGRIKSTDIGSTIHLSGSATENLSNQLNWTNLDIPNVQVDQFHLFRTKGFITTEIPLDQNIQFSSIDLVDSGDPNEVELCYQVMAETNTTLPNGDLQRYESWSNSICVSQSPVIRLPNAFAPSGINNLFRPYIVFSENIDFQMRIFDRWGAQIFETTDYLRGWDGRRGEKEMPLGVYTYIIEITTASGESIEKMGSVALLR